MSPLLLSTDDCLCCTPEADKPETAQAAPAAPGVSSRRRFVQLAALGAGVALLGVPGLARAEGASHGTEALLLTCMDYRLIASIGRYMEGRGLKDQYDHVILAGASLGALSAQKPDWSRAFFDHIKLAKDLHKIHRVIVIDHRDCGAYKLLVGGDYTKGPEAQLAAHSAQLRALRGQIRGLHNDLEVETFLMALDGSVETIA